MLTWPVSSLGFSPRHWHTNCGQPVVTACGFTAGCLSPCATQSVPQLSGTLSQKAAGQGGPEVGEWVSVKTRHLLPPPKKMPNVEEKRGTSPFGKNSALAFFLMKKNSSMFDCYFNFWLTTVVRELPYFICHLFSPVRTIAHTRKQIMHLQPQNEIEKKYFFTCPASK